MDLAFGLLLIYTSLKIGFSNLGEVFSWVRGLPRFRQERWCYIGATPFHSCTLDPNPKMYKLVRSECLLWTNKIRQCLIFWGSRARVLIDMSSKIGFSNYEKYILEWEDRQDFHRVTDATFEPPHFFHVPWTQSLVHINSLGPNSRSRAINLANVGISLVSD